MESIKTTEASDFKACSKSDGLINFLLTERFIITAISFSKLFEILDPATKMLQSPDIDLLGAVNSIQVILDNIKNMRSDNVFAKIYDEALNFVNQSEFEFTPISVKRCRRKKLMPDETNRDHVITDPIIEYKVNTYFLTIDTAITSIEDRFHSTGRHLLKDISFFSIARLKQTKKDASSLPKDAFDAFCEVYNKFINSADLRKEYIQFSSFFFEFEESVGIQKMYIHKENVNESDNENEENSDGEQVLI